MNKVTGLKWDDKFANASFTFEETKAFTDTGTSCILGPAYMIDYITSAILYHIPEYEPHGYWNQLF